jgi:hypothetical protein
MMNVRFDLEVPIKRKRSGIDGVILCYRAAMPFVPSIGMKIIVMPGDDYRSIEEIYWGANEGMIAHLQYDESADIAFLEKLGWREL